MLYNVFLKLSEKGGRFEAGSSGPQPGVLSWPCSGDKWPLLPSGSGAGGGGAGYEHGRSNKAQLLFLLVWLRGQWNAACLAAHRRTLLSCPERCEYLPRCPSTWGGREHCYPPCHLQRFTGHLFCASDFHVQEFNMPSFSVHSSAPCPQVQSSLVTCYTLMFASFWIILGLHPNQTSTLG